MQFSISPALNAKSIHHEFLQDSRVRVNNIMPTGQVESIYKVLHENITFDQAFTLNNQAQLLPRKEIANLGQRGINDLMRQVYQNASQGIGFWYGRAPDSERRNPVLAAFEHWIKSNDVINFIKTATGKNDICNAVIQYTKYTPGEFLTRHKDEGAEGQRRIAFILHLSPQWHPDWGGLLQFYQQDGQPRDAWAPKFGCLHLFDTKHIHAVTTVSPFAAAARYTISGWFTTK